MTVEYDLKYLMPGKNRHGRPILRVRVKVNGRFRTKVINEKPGDPGFLKAYTVAVDALKSGQSPEAPARVKGAPAGSLGWLAAEYFGSAEFGELGGAPTARGVIEGCLREPLEPGSKHLMRDCPYKLIDATHVMMLRDRKVKAGLPGAANNRRKYLGAMFSWAIEARRFDLTHNPCRDTKKAKHVSDGYRTWTVDNVRQYIRHHPIGTMAYLALCLMLFLGARRGDASRLGPANMQEGWMVYVPRKRQHRSVEASHKPILAPLAEAIKATPTGLKTFLVTAYGKPFSDAGLGNKMRQWCDEAGLPECTAHGLKKAAATICADLGATDRQMMMLFDWTSERMATPYTRAANRRRLAGEAAKLLGMFSLEPDENRSEAV